MKISVAILFFFIIVKIGFSQDPILSQPFLSSQFLSPAVVGSGMYSQRIQSNYRNHTVGDRNLFKTIVIGWDRKLYLNESENSGFLGIGAQVMSDQLIGGLLNTNYFTVSSAYHLYFNNDNSTDIAIGLGGTFAQTNLDRSQLSIGEMFDPMTGAQVVSYTGLNFAALNFKPFPTRFSANTGILLTKHNKSVYLQTGASAFFFSKPDITTSDLIETPGMRSTIFLNFEKSFNDYNTFLIHGSFNDRNKISQKLAGASVSFPFYFKNEIENRLYLGLYYRFEDAFIPAINLLINDYAFGASYDIYSNALTSARIRTNAFELTFSKSFGQKREQKMRTLFD